MRTHFCTRLAGHVRVFNGWKAGKQPYISSFEILTDPECRITLLETFLCNTKDELTAKEQFHIDQNHNICINRQKAYAGIKAGLTKQEYKAIYNQQYRKEHQEAIKAYEKRYHEENHETYRVLNKQYCEKNKELIKACKSQKVQCDCIRVYSKNSKSQHEQTFIHQKFLKMIP
jgi:hypothetical protein